MWLVENEFRKFYGNLYSFLKPSNKYYNYIILTILILLSTYIAIPIYTDFIKFDSNKELLINYCVTFYLLITLEIVLQLYVIKKKELFNIKKLTIYPYPPYFEKFFPYAVLLFDKKNLIWLVFSIILLLKYVIISTNIYMIPLGIIVIAQVYFSLNIFLYYFFHFFRNIIFKGNLIGIIIFMNIIIFNMLNITKKMDMLYNVPIIKSLANIFYSANNSLYYFFIDIVIINSLFFAAVILLYIVKVNKSIE